jgi:hypothetical protein
MPFKHWQALHNPVMSKGPEISRECSPSSKCYMSHVTCHMSHVTSHMSHNTGQTSLILFLFLFYKVFELVGGGSEVKISCSVLLAGGISHPAYHCNTGGQGGQHKYFPCFHKTTLVTWSMMT